ncbi:MAG TPA: DUF3667 domain-containing protein [Ideonella sp.]|nr:DUF3667 domain-containing protein [Ideonella sp.]
MRQLRPAEHCLNCGTAVATRFCPECGQENTSYRVSLGRLVGDLVEEVFQLESRLWRTLWTLVRHPGRLTVEYNAGRRVRYTTPLRLYLVCSVVYFFVGGVMPHARVAEIKFQAGDDADLARAESKVGSPLGRRVLERMRLLQRDPAATSRHIQEALSEYAPKIAAVLVPLLAFMTWLCFRRPKLFFVEHLVFALHAHATAFLLLLPGELVAPSLLVSLGVVATMVLMFVAMRRTFGQSRWATLWKSALIALVYSIFLGLGTGAAVMVALFTGG